MMLAELPEFARPDHDNWFIDKVIRNWSDEDREVVRFMYSELECMCGSSLEGMMCVGLCAEAHRRGCDPLEIRKFIRPQYAVGWCRLDFFVQPYLDHPGMGFGVECDGEKWHQDAGRDGRRDSWILGQGVNEIYRYTGKEISTDSFWCAHRACKAFETSFKRPFEAELFR